jgi:hypothetical protein
MRKTRLFKDPQLIIAIHDAKNVPKSFYINQYGVSAQTKVLF